MPSRKRARASPEQGVLTNFVAHRPLHGRYDIPRNVEEEEALFRQALEESLKETISIACPLCGGEFPRSSIEQHASTCGEMHSEENDGMLQDAIDPLKLNATLTCNKDKDQHIGSTSSVRRRVSTHGSTQKNSDTVSAEDKLGQLEERADCTFEREAHDDCTIPHHDKATGLACTAWNQLPFQKPSKTAVNEPIRAVPFYKILEGMPLCVDAFRYGRISGCTGYFLTHFHSDHYGGLSSRWCHGPIYCSKETARLVTTKLRVDQKWVRPLVVNQRTWIPDSGDVYVTCIDANHCPGSCIMLFEGRQTANIASRGSPSRHIGSARVFRYLHCGDFRACPAQVRHEALQGTVDIVYLDTTYLNPRYCFPAQPEVIDACVKLMYNTIPTPPKPSLLHWMQVKSASNTGGDFAPLAVVGTYSIGKERLAKALAKALHTRIYCSDPRKYETYAQLDDPELHSRLTHNPIAARVHISSLFSLTVDALRDWTVMLQNKGMRVTHTFAFRPTGWTFCSKVPNVSPSQPVHELLEALVPPTIEAASLTATRDSTDTVRVYGVPYSEHSSFYELMAFVLSLRHIRIIPTVNVGTAASRSRMRAWIDQWTAASRRSNGIMVPPRSELYW